MLPLGSLFQCIGVLGLIRDNIGCGLIENPIQGQEVPSDYSCKKDFSTSGVLGAATGPECQKWCMLAILSISDVGLHSFFKIVMLLFNVRLNC